MTDLKKQRKKNKAGDNPEEGVSDHVALHDKIFDDNRLSNRIAEILFEICEEKNWTVKQILLAVLESLMNKVVEEEVPLDVDKEPTMGNVGVCGFSSDMAGMAFTELVESKPFHSWMYQVILTHPYCFPLRGKSNLKLSGSIEHRIITLTTTILGIFWNNRVRFGDSVVVKKPSDSPIDLPDFTPEIIEAVKKVVRSCARICRSNLGRGKSGKKKEILPSSDDNVEAIEDVPKAQVRGKQLKRKSPTKKKRAVVSKKKQVSSETIDVSSSSEEEAEEEEEVEEEEEEDDPDEVPSYKQVSSSTPYPSSSSVAKKRSTRSRQKTTV